MKILFSLICIFSLKTYAQLNNESRFIAAGGFGQAQAKSATTGQVRSESPGGLSFSVDKHFSGPYFILAEHMRSLGAGGSSVGMTGVGLKFYPWANPIHFQKIQDLSIRSKISFAGYFPYFGSTLGFAQASMIGTSTTEDILVVGGYLDMKSGVEFPLSERWGLISEFNFITTVFGSGTVQALNFLFGVYIAF